LFYHYQITNHNQFEVIHGYAMQTVWNHWFYREESECSLSPSQLKSRLVRTYSNLDPLETTFKFIPLSKADEEWYLEAKKHVFEVNHSPKMIINALLKLANQRYDLKISFDSYLKNKCIEVPDLGIYRFMIEENLRRRDIYNIAATTITGDE
jgi:hypothetical protein